MEILDFETRLWDKTLAEVANADEDIWLCSYSWAEPWSTPKTQMVPTRARFGWEQVDKYDAVKQTDAIRKHDTQHRLHWNRTTLPWVRTYLKSGALSDKSFTTKHAHAFTTEKSCREYYSKLLEIYLIDLAACEKKIHEKAAKSNLDITSLLNDHRETMRTMA